MAIWGRMSCLISDLVLIFDFMSYVIVGPVCYICFSFSQSCEIFKSFIFAKLGLHSFCDILSEILLSNSLLDSVGFCACYCLAQGVVLDFWRTWVFGEHGFLENMVIMCDHFNKLIAVRLHVFEGEFVKQ